MRRAITALTLTFGLAIPALAQSFEERLSVCLACHGEKGISETAEVPSLAGMPAKFTLIQLYLFRERMRKIEIMNDVAKGMTDDDLRKFSEYFEKLAAAEGLGRCPARKSRRVRRR